MTGPNFTTVSACATGGHALGESSRDHPARRRRHHGRRRRRGRHLRGRSSVGSPRCAPCRPGTTTRRRASRPFDSGRDGFVIGEGAGVVVLEALEHAEARGATILAELVGYGATADASHITLPAPGGIGAVRAARRALEKAGMTPADIDHVNAHATSTPEGDKSELQAIRTIFGDDAGRVSVTANKSMIGPHARRGRRDRGDRHDPDHPRRLRPADDQPRRPRTRRRRAGPHPERRRQAARSARRSATRSGSAARTRRSSSRRPRR